jgi:LysR family glycine cleavage system transcriptional activator
VPPVAPNLPPLAALRAFEAVARHLSFRTAADELSVTQSAVSHQVAELERRLGVSLFHRHSRRVELTEAGAMYQPYVREAFDRIAQGTSLVTLGAPARELDVQVYVTVAVRWLIPRLHSFTTAHPDVKVRLNTSHIDWDFAADESDVAIVCTDRSLRPGLHATHLFDADLVAVCSPSVVDTDPLHQPLLQLFTAPDECDVWLAAAGVTGDTLRGTIRVDSYLLAIEAALDGQGLAVVPWFLVGADVRNGRLAMPIDVRVEQPRRWYLVCRSDRAEQRSVVLFREWLRAQAADDPFIADR